MNRAICESSYEYQCDMHKIVAFNQQQVKEPALRGLKTNKGRWWQPVVYRSLTTARHE